jgi:hypothetical protein
MVPQLFQVQVTRRTPEARPASATMPAHATGGDRSAFADQLSAALDRYGFSVCRSASVFEDFDGYAAVIVLLSPGAARSDLVMGTAQRALDCGKLIPVFVNLCRLPDRLAGVAMHDLSAWDGAEDDRVVQAIAYHVQRAAGLPGRPDLGPPRMQVEDRSYGYQQPRLAHDPGQGWAPQYDYGQQHAREPYFVATAYNQVEHYPDYGHDDSYLSAIDAHVNVAPNDHGHHGQHAQRPQRDYDRMYFQSGPATIEHSYDEPEPVTRRRGPLPSVFTVLLCAMALMGTAWLEEARTREVAQLTAKPAEATAFLSDPSVTDPGDTARKRIEHAH